ncbi:MAG TPA: hypothetical protein DEB06_11860 [Phycisphaerales bacterium]|nr:hypothetical protein [Phycisphaerales bacterium]
MDLRSPTQIDPLLGSVTQSPSSWDGRDLSLRWKQPKEPSSTRPKRPTRAELNKRLARAHAELLKQAEQNTVRLLGVSRL